jgi:type I restriction enzyme, S subunit
VTEHKALGDVADFASGKFLAPADRMTEGAVPVYGANGLIGRTSHVLYGESVITVGRVGACGEVHRTDGPAWISDNALVVRPKAGVLFDYLYYALQSVDYASIRTGTTQPLITQTALKTLSIPVPDDLADQRAAVKILAATDEVVRQEERRFSALVELERALADEVFVARSADWQVAQLSSVADVDRGVSWAKDQESVRPGEGRVAVVRIGNVQRDAIDMTSRLYLADVKERDLQRKALTENHVLMVGSNGNVERIGNAFRATAGLQDHVFASFLIGVRCADPDAALYTTTWLRSPHMQKRLRDSTSGSTGLKNLGLTTLRAMEIPIAPKRVAGMLVEAAADVESTRARLAATTSTAYALRRSLVADVFARQAA